MRSRLLVLLPICVALFVACVHPLEPVSVSAQALTTCITVQRGTSGAVVDAELRAASPTSNYGSLPSATIGIYSGAQRQALVRWDLSSVPSNAIVSSATATITNNISSGASTVIAYATGAAWPESTVTWTSASAPIGGTALASAANSGIGGTTPSSFTLDLTTVAQGWVTTPASNNGVALDSGVVANNLVTSEGGTVAIRPKLVLCYLSQCSDGVKNGNETDVDCGGSCSPCADGFACNVAADCQHAICGAGICHPVGGAAIATVSTCAQPVLATVMPIDVQYGTTSVQMLTVYPADPSCTPPAGGYPVWIDVHGGGFTGDGGGRNSSALAQHMQWLAKQCIVGVTMDYRLTSGTAPSAVNPFPAAVNDGRCAVRWVAANIASHGGDPARIGATGYSAGFGIVGKVATEAGFTSTQQGASIAYDADGTCPLAWSASDATILKRVASYYGNSDFTVVAQWSAYNPNGYEYLNVTGTGDPNWNARATAASVHWTWGNPPIFLTDGSADTTVLPAMLSGLDTTVRTQAGVASSLLVIASGIHGFAPNTGPYGGVNYVPASCTHNAWILFL